MSPASSALVLVCATGNEPCCMCMSAWVTPAHVQAAVYMSPACGARLLGRVLMKERHKEPTCMSDRVTLPARQRCWCT